MANSRPKETKCLFDAWARVLTVAFALLLAIPAVGSFFADHMARSRWENRPLVELSVPALSKNGLQIFDLLDQYLNDHFGFALELNRLHRELLFYVFRDSPSPDISLGKDGFVFVTSFKSAPFSVLEAICVRGMDMEAAKPAAEGWVEIILGVAEIHKNVALLIVPSKPTLYPEKLSAAVPSFYRDACAQYNGSGSVSAAIVDAVRKSGHVAIYPYEEFLADRYVGNFYPRENFHYSGSSAHMLGREALRQLGIPVSVEYEEGLYGPTITHDLMNLLGFTRSLMETTYSYAAFGVAEESGTPHYIRDYFERGQQFGVFTAAKPLSQRTALLVGNSFTPFTAKHLAPGYRSLTYIMINDLQEAEYLRFFSELIPRIGADDLIFVYNDHVAAGAAQLWREKLAQASTPP